ncbi:MAG: hypothetical protein AB8G77_08025 [Rhodothermales bacterium]
MDLEKAIKTSFTTCYEWVQSRLHGVGRRPLEVDWMLLRHRCVVYTCAERCENMQK